MIFQNIQHVGRNISDDSSIRIFELITRYYVIGYSSLFMLVKLENVDFDIDISALKMYSCFHFISFHIVKEDGPPVR